MGIGQLVYGPVSDRVGRRLPLLCGLGLFLLGTAGCAVASSIDALTGARQARLPTLVAGIVLAVDALSGRLGVLVPLFFCLSSAGLIGPNAMACALSVDPMRAGTVSSISGSATFVLGALVSTLTGRVQDGSPRPMAVIVLAAMLASALALYGFAVPVARESSRLA